MKARKWRKRNYQYNPSKPKVLRFGPNRSAPHAQYQAIESKDGTTYRGCACTACRVYLQAIAKLNPDRFHSMITPPERNFFNNKSLPEHVHRRRLLAYSIGTWRG